MGGNTGEIQILGSERELYKSTLIIKQGQQKLVLELYYLVHICTIYTFRLLIGVPDYSSELDYIEKNIN